VFSFRRKFVYNVYTICKLISLSLSSDQFVPKSWGWKSKSNKNPDALFFQLFQIIMCGEEIHLILLILIMTSRFCYLMICRFVAETAAVSAAVSDRSLLYKQPGLDLSLPYNNTLSDSFSLQIKTVYNM